MELHPPLGACAGPHKGVSLTGMARPSLAQGASPLVAAKVPSELADRIDQVCAALDMSRSEVIRGALTAGLPVLESETAA